MREFSEVEEFQTVISHEEIRDEITLRVEMRSDWRRRPGTAWTSRCTGAWEAHEGLNFRVERAGGGELPRFELKAAGPIDQRDMPGGGRPDVTLDLLGNPSDRPEERLLAVYEELKALCDEDLPPIAACNVRAALALMHNVVMGLALEYEHLTDLGS